MNKVIRINQTLANTINDLKEEYIFFYRNTAKTKNKSLKEMAERELERAATYREQDWILYAAYKELIRLKEINKDEKI